MKIIRRAEMRMDWQNQQQKALANFYVDVKIRQYNLETAFGEKNRQKFKELAITEGPDFRPFVVSFPPQGTENLMKEMQPYLGSLSAHEQTVISFYLNYAGLFEIYYARLGSDEFVALPKHRKIGAFETFFDIADNVAVLCPTVIKAMRDKHDSVESLDAESDRLIKRNFIPVARR